tara:strand:- start:96 stop:323 length:228 start_codon:yes stop_codon:yes gene_type:complete
MQNTLKFINSLTNDSINKIRNSKSDAEARRILKETNTEFLQSCVVGQSEQLVCSCGSRLVKTTGGYHCGNAKCST